MFSEDVLNLCRYRLSKAEDFLRDAEETLKLEMYETAANRSYYSIFHSVRGLLALDEKDFKKHSAVIAYFQSTYIKTGLLPVELSDILKSAFSLRTESDYKDFFVIAKEDVICQVSEAKIFFETVRDYVEKRIAAS
jgi:uncharacterized protein (UPF0332 family)